MMEGVVKEGGRSWVMERMVKEKFLSRVKVIGFNCFFIGNFR